MSIKLQIKRGKKANLPKLAAGEPGFTTDEQKLYIGTGSDNVAMAREDHNHAGVYQPVGDYLTSETDPTVPAWAKAASKPAYTADEVGAATSLHSHSTADITSGTLSITRGGTGVTSIGGTDYTTTRFRGSQLRSTDTPPTTNGTINWTYE